MGRGPRPAVHPALWTFTLSLVVYLFCQRTALLMQVPRPLVWVALAPCTSSTAWRWLAARGLFDDRFRWDWPNLAAGAAMVAFGLLSNAPRLESKRAGSGDPGPGTLTSAHAVARVPSPRQRCGKCFAAGATTWLNRVVSLGAGPPWASAFMPRSQQMALPRGCLDAALARLKDNGIRCDLQDEKFVGEPIPVDFIGTLRPDQEWAVAAMLKHDAGVLCALTAPGNTVTAAAIIARRGLNPLVLVHRTELLKQWH
jgi:hypothetical protein